MNGIGHAFPRAMAYLETSELFARGVLLALKAVIEFGVLWPVRKRLLRWRRGLSGPRAGGRPGR